MKPSVEDKILLELIDEIKKNNLNEFSFLGAIKDLFKQFFGEIFDFFKETYTGSRNNYTSSWNSISSDYSKKAGLTGDEEFEPDKNPKQLMVWAVAQQKYISEMGDKLDPTKNLETAIQEVSRIKVPMPDPNDEETKKLWGTGGEYTEIAKRLAQAAGVAMGWASHSVGFMSKEWQPIVSEMESKVNQFAQGGKNSSLIDLLEAIKIWCEGVENSKWKTAMQKAAKIQKDFEWVDVTINPNDFLSRANSILRVATSEMTRLENEKGKIMKPESESSKAGGAAGTEATGAGTSESISKTEDRLLLELIEEIKSRYSV